MATTFFIEQTAFTTGEVSPPVGNRTDLDKYPYALALAKNCWISPYGPVAKRTGLEYVDEIPTEAILEKFIYTKEIVYLLVVRDKVISVYLNDEHVTDVATPYSKGGLRQMRFNQSNDVVIITDGVNPPKVLARYSHTDWRLEDFEITHFPMAAVNRNSDVTITASGLDGTVTLTANKDVFTQNMVGTDIELIHDVQEQIVELKATGESNAIYCEEFVLSTSGFWVGTVAIDKSTDGVTWKRIRTYKGNEDLNIKEGGSVSSPSFLRLTADVKKGQKDLTFHGTLRGKERTSHGMVRITAVTDGKTAVGTVTTRIGSTEPTDTWKKSYWENGMYPKVSCFWQDRLWFAGRTENIILFGSRTSDYTNFSVERVSGDLTDDSACIFPLITRETFNVNWLVGGKDLIILADGVEYRVDGDRVVTPKEFQASVQSSRGSSDCRCHQIGDQVIYVQRGGSTVREMGYSQERASYVGEDLTIFVKHMTRGHQFIDSTYKQEPNSMIYFVRDDGVVCCLSYIKEQQVFAWSTVETDGKILSVMSIQKGNDENVYCVVERWGNHYIEKFASISQSEHLYDHVYMDSAIERKDVYSNVVTGLERFKGKKVHAVFYENKEGATSWYLAKQKKEDGFIVDDNGTLTFPCEISKCRIGIPYTAEIETLNVETKMQGLGTLQGKEKEIVSCVLRIANSYGGQIGQARETTYNIFYLRAELYTEDLKCDIGGDRNLKGRLYIKHDEPTPFVLQSIVREVSV